jgi:hypothetical protein
MYLSRKQRGKIMNKLEVAVDVTQGKFSYRIEALNGIDIKESRSLKFSHKNNKGNKIYYASSNGYELVRRQFKICDGLIDTRES